MIVNINGNDIFYELRGSENAKETVAFFNGVMASANSWGYQAALFEKMGYRVLLHDFKGQLKSGKPKGPYSFKEHAQEAKILMDKLGINKVHIVGTSYGGEVALRFAIDYPEYVKSVSVIDSVSEIDDKIRYFIDGWKRAAEEKDAKKFFFGMMPTIYGNSFIEKNMNMLSKRAEDMEKFPKDYFEGQIYLYETFLNDLNLTKELHKIKSPVLFILGEEDILKPRKFVEKMVAEIPESEFIVIPDCGHVAIFEKYDTVNSMLLGFIMKN